MMLGVEEGEGEQGLEEEGALPDGVSPQGISPGAFRGAQTSWREGSTPRSYQDMPAAPSHEANYSVHGSVMGGVGAVEGGEKTYGRGYEHEVQEEEYKAGEYHYNEVSTFLLNSLLEK
jgi:hypothetical protein